MPARGDTKYPAKVISKAVERYKRGEKVAALAEELGVSQAAIYLWLAADKREETQRVMKVAMAPKSAAKAEKRDLAQQNEALKEENARLKDKIVELMIRLGEI